MVVCPTILTEQKPRATGVHLLNAWWVADAFVSHYAVINMD